MAMTNPAHLVLPRFSREEIRTINAVLSLGGDLLGEAAESPWRFGFEAAWPGDKAGSVVIVFRLDEGRFALCTNPAFFRHGLGQLTACESLPALPEALALAVLETLLQRIAAFLQQATGRRLTLAAEGYGAAPPDLRHRLAWWSVNRDDERLQGLLLCDSLGLALLSDVLGIIGRRPTPAAAWSGLPVSVRLAWGELWLDWQTLTSLEVGDVLLHDTWREPASLSLCVASETLFPAHFTENRLTLLEPNLSMMSAYPPENGEDGDAPAPSLNRLPVKIRFDLGELTMPLAELQALRPGQTLELDRDLRRAVTLRVNGVNIGEGTLVDIEGRLGVMLVSLSPPATGEATS